MIKASAPGKIILFGEHAVVHKNSEGEFCLGISTSVNKRCFVSLEENNENKITIESANLGIEEIKTFNEITELINKLDELRRHENYSEIKNISLENKLVLVYTVIGKIMCKYGFKPVKIKINSEVPKCMGSSSSLCSATALATLEHLSQKVSIEEIGNFANHGDMNAHGKSSGIDAFTSTYGGWNTYTQSENVKHLESGLDIPLVVIDTGKPANTSETVSHFIELKKEHPREIMAILDEMDRISHEALDLIKKKSKIKKIGELFFEYYNTLKKVDEISSSQKKIFFNIPEFEKIIQIAKENDFFAKPTGGWGGGICIAIGDNSDKIISKYKERGFECFKVQTGTEGIRLEK